MSKRETIKVILIVIVIMLIFGSVYHRYKINKISSETAFLTLINIKSSLQDITVYYENEYKNQPISKDEIIKDKLLYNYLIEMRKIANYVSRSISFRGSILDLKLEAIKNIDEGGITREDIEYLNNALVKYEEITKKINNEQSNNILRRMFCYLTKTNLMELESVFEGYPEQ